MLKQIWQRLLRWFKRWFGVDRRRNPTSPTIHYKPPPSLTDTDYEFLFIELLEGVAHGWQQARVLRFFEVLSERGKQELWIAWLRRFGERLLDSSVPNNELAARMVQLGELGCGEITDIAYEIGMQLLTKPTETYWENASVNSKDEREDNSQSDGWEEEEKALDKLLELVEEWGKIEYSSEEAKAFERVMERLKKE